MGKTIDVRNDHYEAIGRVASNWAMLEFTIDSYCWLIADLTPAAGACFTAQMIGPAKRLDALLALITLRYPEFASKKKLNAVAGDIREASNKRNRYVHDVWTAESNGLAGMVHQRLEITAKSAVFVRFVDAPTKELVAFAEEIITLNDRLDGVLGHLMPKHSTE